MNNKLLDSILPPLAETYEGGNRYWRTFEATSAEEAEELNRLLTRLRASGLVTSRLPAIKAFQLTNKGYLHFGDRIRRLKGIKVTGTSMAWNGLLENLNRLIQEWQCRPLKRETDYSDSLAAFIRGHAPKMLVEREYRHLGTTVDIYVRWSGRVLDTEAFIELKRNLKSKASLDRLIGQIETLQPDKNQIIIVLCGETDPALLGRLQKRYERWTEDDLFWPSMRIAVKPHAVSASIVR